MELFLRVYVYEKCIRSLYEEKISQNKLNSTLNGYPNSEIKASENHVGVKRGVKLRSLSCNPIRSVL